MSADPTHRHDEFHRGLIPNDQLYYADIPIRFQWELHKVGVLTATTDVAEYFRAPYARAVDEVVAHVGTAPLVQAVILDVNDDGTTIFTTQGNRPSIGAGTNDDTAGTADGGQAIAANSVITVDVDQIGVGTVGSDLTLFIRGHYT